MISQQIEKILSIRTFGQNFPVGDRRAVWMPMEVKKVQLMDCSIVFFLTRFFAHCQLLS